MAEKINGMALGSMAAGTILIYSGITGRSALASLYSIVSGKNPKDVAKTLSISGQESATAGSSNSGGSAGSSPSQYEQYAFSQFPKYGWGADQQAPLISLWNRESGWNPKATNPSSGAYGIPQSLPANKMASSGADWQTNPATQINWGLQYIHSTYGSPAMAWAHETANGWY